MLCSPSLSNRRNDIQLCSVCNINDYTKHYLQNDTYTIPTQNATQFLEYDVIEENSKSFKTVISECTHHTNPFNTM